MKPKIFVFSSGKTGAGWLHGVALAEDGHLLAAHLSSGRDWLRIDMGLASGLKHDVYRVHYNEGYELVEVPDDAILGHHGLAQALQRNRELGLQSKPADSDPGSGKQQ